MKVTMQCKRCDTLLVMVYKKPKITINPEDGFPKHCPECKKLVPIYYTIEEETQEQKPDA